MAGIEEYLPIVGESVIADLRLISQRLKGNVVQHINSTYSGGGVAEILNRMIPLFRELGVDAKWDVISGNEKFYGVTKKFHNMLHGKTDSISKEEFDIFLETGEKNKSELPIYGDVVFVHDPQPITLVENRKGNRWIWRCHIDVSDPDQRVWKFLLPYVNKYDASIFTAAGFSQLLKIRQFLIQPSIDPLSDKNKDIPDDYIESVMKKYDIDMQKPIITQISRFDRLKDPAGVIQAFKLVKKYVNCQLILAGGGADDDPEGMEVFKEVQERASEDKDIRILMLPQNDLEINALQRASSVIMQKSLKEGFGLTVTEALWKAKPVVASYVGGIPLQITNKYSGLLCHNIEGAAFYLKQLLNNPEYGQRLGKNGKEHVRGNFLITRHLRDYMLLMLAVLNEQSRNNVIYF